MTLALVMLVTLLLLSAAGITGFASNIKELLQKGADLDEEEAKLRGEWKTLHAAQKSAKDRKLTEEQSKRKLEIESRLEAISAERVENDEALKNERAAQEIERRQTGVIARPAIADKPFASDGEFYQTVAAAYGADVEGMRVSDATARLMAGATGGSTQPADGGFPIGKERSMAMLNRADEQAVLVPLCDTYEVSEGFDGVEMPVIDETSRATGSRWGGVRAYRRAEARTVEDVQVKYGEFDVRLEDLMAVAYLTERQLKDARVTAQILNKAVSSEFAFKQDDEIVRGNGGGEMTGYMNADALVTVDAESGQAADTVVPDNISKMWRAMPTRNKKNAVWVFNGELGPTLDKLFIPAGVGALEPRFIQYGPDGILRIKGRPCLEIEQASAPGDVGDFALVDFSEYLLARQGGMESDESIHVRYLYRERAFRFFLRVNGRPKWKSTIAPYKGNVSKSPYVVLGAR